MKNLIRIFLIVVIVGASISIGSSCSDENDCSLAGRPMMYCTLYTIDEITDRRVNDTLDSLTITALGTDSIILNNQKKVHTLMLPLRYTSDTTVFILWYNPNSPTNKKDVDTLYIIQKNTAKISGCIEKLKPAGRFLHIHNIRPLLRPQSNVAYCYHQPKNMRHVPQL